jgi:hypothetical protein
MSEDPARAVAIFAEALQHPVVERRAFLERACAGDDELRRKVEALLRAHDRLGNFMEPSPPGFPVTLDPPIDGEPPEPDANTDKGDSKSK